MGILQKKRRPPVSLSGFINHPVTDTVVMILIIISVVLLVIEESMALPPNSMIPLVSEAITVVFAIELFVRYLAAKKKGRFFRRYWADLLAILPLLRPLRFFRFFRLFRLFRLFQLGFLLDRRVTLLRGVLRVNFYFLWALLVLTVILVVGSAVMGYIFEHQNGQSFANMQESLWWAVYTIIAGEPIGDMPVSPFGRILLALMMLSGMALFAVFTGLVSATMINRLQGLDGVAELDIDELEGHICLFGWNAGVPHLLAELAVDPDLKGVPILLVNELEEPPDLGDTGLRQDLLYNMQADYTQVQILAQAGIRRASRAVVVADDVRSHNPADRDARTVLAALTIERLNPEIYCVVELMNAANRDTLGLVQVEAVIMRSDLSGRALASAVRHPNVMEVMMNLLTMRRGETIQRLPGPKVAMSFGELLHRVKEESDVLVIGVESAKHGTQVNPPHDQQIEPEDWLMVIGGANK